MLTARSPVTCWQSSEFSHRLNCRAHYEFILPKIELNRNYLLGKFISLGNGEEGNCDEVWCASLPFFESVYHMALWEGKLSKDKQGLPARIKTVIKTLFHIKIK